MFGKEWSKYSVDQKTQFLEIAGCVFIALMGLGLGFALPGHNSHLHGFWSRTINIMNWTYFTCWSVSFYPQVILNFARGSVTGLSFDYTFFNITAFVCYSIYNCAFFWNKSIQAAYRDIHNGRDNLVALSDVGFAVHAAFITIVTLGQLIYYRDEKQKGVSWFCLSVCGSLFLIAVGFVSIVYFGLVVDSELFTYLNWLYLLSFFKLGITVLKYCPQVHLNYIHQSTVGVDIHQWLLDFAGGCLSVSALILESGLSDDWSAISGDIVKVLLGLISMSFDVVFFVQHFYLYKDSQFDPFLVKDEPAEVIANVTQDYKGFDHLKEPRGLDEGPQLDNII